MPGLLVSPRRFFFSPAYTTAQCGTGDDRREARFCEGRCRAQVALWPRACGQSSTRSLALVSPSHVRVFVVKSSYIPYRHAPSNPVLAARASLLSVCEREGVLGDPCTQCRFRGQGSWASLTKSTNLCMILQVYSCPGPKRWTCSVRSPW